MWLSLLIRVWKPWCMPDVTGAHLTLRVLSNFFCHLSSYQTVGERLFWRCWQPFQFPKSPKWNLWWHERAHENVKPDVPRNINSFIQLHDEWNGMGLINSGVNDIIWQAVPQFPFMDHLRNFASNHSTLHSPNIQCSLPSSHVFKCSRPSAILISFPWLTAVWNDLSIFLNEFCNVFYLWLS